MKPVLLTTTIAALIAVAACNRAPDNPTSASTNGSGNASVPDSATGNMVTPPAGQLTAAQAYEVRHERYEEMGDSMKAINRELKGSAPDVPRIQGEAAMLAGLAQQMAGWFPTGSGPDVHARSRAKAEIWSDPQGFAQAHQGYMQQAQSFKRVTDGGDVEQIRAAAQTLGKACSQCHDKYRAPER
jgi:cytochrome c556